MIGLFQGYSFGKIFVKIFEIFSIVAFFVAVISLFAPNFEVTLQGGEFERQSIFLCSIILAILGVIVAGVIRGSTGIPNISLGIPFVLFLVVYGISATFGGDPWRSVWGAWEYPGRGVIAFVAYTGLFFLVARLLRMGKELVVYSALFLGIMVATITAGFGEGVFHGGFSKDPTLPILWSMSFVVILGVVHAMIMRNASFARIAVVVVWILLAVTCFFTAYRFGIASWLWMFVATVSWCFLALLIAVTRNTRKAWFPVITFLVAIGAYALGSMLSINGETRLSFVPITETISVSRGALAESPWFGMAPASYESAFLKYRSSEDISLDAFDISGSRVGLMGEILVTSGIFGISAFIFLLLSLLGLALRLDRVVDDGMIIRLSAIISAFTVWGAVLLLPVSGSFIGIAFLLLAMAIVSGESKETAQSEMRLIRMRPKPEYALSAAFLFVVLFAGAGYMFVTIYTTVSVDVQAKSAVLSKNPEEARALFEEVSAKQPLEGWYDVLLGERFVELAELIPIDTEDEEMISRLESMINASSDRFSRAQEKLPKDFHSRERIGDAYVRLSVYVPNFLLQAQMSYEDAVALNPRDSQLRIRLGEIVIRRVIAERDPEKKREFLTKAQSTLVAVTHSHPGQIQAKYLLAIVEEGLGNIEDAIRYAQEVLSAIPEDVHAKQLVARLLIVRDSENDRDQGIALYEGIIALDSCDSVSLVGLGDVYANDDANRAREYYNRAIVCMENSDDASAIQSLQKKRDALDSSISNFEEEEALSEEAHVFVDEVDEDVLLDEGENSKIEDDGIDSIEKE